jgi:hypothetical protein
VGVRSATGSYCVVIVAAAAVAEIDGGFSREAVEWVVEWVVKWVCVVGGGRSGCRCGGGGRCVVVGGGGGPFGERGGVRFRFSSGTGSVGEYFRNRLRFVVSVCLRLR